MGGRQAAGGGERRFVAARLAKLRELTDRNRCAGLPDDQAAAMALAAVKAVGYRPGESARCFRRLAAL